MPEESVPNPDPQATLQLKLQEADVDAKNPWHDDVLSRKDVADRLTAIVCNQSEPFVISLHGAWGTGKTFTLKRWQRDLESQEFKAIYFNAWEEDFSDEPLLTIAGQLSEYFKSTGFRDVATDAARVAGTLLIRNLKGIANRVTGASFDADGLDSESERLVGEYLALHASKDRLKKELTRLSRGVFEETGHPLVFIIDELDRCRPTFAVELLERIKHIFDIPNIVFVLGINRDELCESIKSIYGNVDANTYLRRFFNLELTLPQVNLEGFSRYLIDKYGLRKLFQSLSNRANDRVHFYDFEALESDFPRIWSHLPLSLRDIENCVQIIALVGKQMVPGNPMFPYPLGLLVPLKLINPHLYRQYVQGTCLGSRVMDEIEDNLINVTPVPVSVDPLVRCEIFLYLADSLFGTPSTPPYRRKIPAVEQLELQFNGQPLTNPEYLSRRTRAEGYSSERTRHLIGELNALSQPRSFQSSDEAFPRNIITAMAKVIDLYQDILAR